MLLYVDTNIILDILFEKKSKAKTDNELMIKKIKSKYEIKIPQIIVGEVIVKIIEKASPPSSKFVLGCTMDSFFRLIRYMTDLNYNSPVINRSILQTALELVKDELTAV